MAAVQGAMSFVAVAANSMDESAENKTLPMAVDDPNVPGVERVHRMSWHRDADEAEEEVAVNELDCEKVNVVLDLEWQALRRIWKIRVRLMMVNEVTANGVPGDPQLSVPHHP